VLERRKLVGEIATKTRGRVFFSLLLYNFLPTVYASLRVRFLGDYVGEESFDVASQIQWLGVIFEVVQEALILPLFFFINSSKLGDADFVMRVRNVFSIVLIIGLASAIVVYCSIDWIVRSVQIDVNLLVQTVVYIRIEIIAFFFFLLLQFVFVVLITLERWKILLWLTVMKVVLIIGFDIVLLSYFQLGVKALGYSNTIINVLLIVVSLFVLNKMQVNLFRLTFFNWRFLRKYRLFPYFLAQNRHYAMDVIL